AKLPERTGVSSLPLSSRRAGNRVAERCESCWAFGTKFRSVLVNLRECAHVKLECLVVLAFDLQLGLQLFHQDFEARNLHAQFLYVGGSSSGARTCCLSGRWSLRRGRIPLLHESLGQRARP